MTDWKCPNCSWANREFSIACLSCGASRPTDTPAHRSGDLARPGSPTPSLVTHEPLPVPVAAPTAMWATDGLYRGLGFAAGAAVLAAATWYLVVVISEYELGIVAALVGWVVGTAAVIGSGRRGSLWLVAGSVLLTLTALVVAEYLIWYHFATQIVGPFGLLRSPLEVIEIVIELLATNPISLLFWGFAVYSAASVPFRTIGAEPQPAAQPLPTTPDGQVSP